MIMGTRGHFSSDLDVVYFSLSVTHCVPELPVLHIPTHLVKWQYMYIMFFKCHTCHIFVISTIEEVLISYKNVRSL